MQLLHNMENRPYVSGTSKFSDVQDTNEYYYIGYLGNDYFVVSDQTGKNGVVDNKGKIVLETKYDTIEKPEKVNLI